MASRVRARRTARWPVELAVACALVTSGLYARAGEDERARARTAYEAATRAATQGDYASAARLFAAADDLVPSDAALESALKAAMLAGEAVLGMRLVERASGRTESATLAPVAAEARARFAARVGTLVVDCGGVACTAALDGEALVPGAPKLCEVGAHAVSIRHRDHADDRTIAIEPGATLRIVYAPPPPAPPIAAPPPRLPRPDAAAPRAGGLSPVWFWMGAGVTALTGGAAIASAVDTRARHDDYLATGAGAGDGRSAQARTNVLFFATLGLAALTTSLAVFAIDWSSGRSRAAGWPPPRLAAGSFR